MTAEAESGNAGENIVSTAGSAQATNTPTGCTATPAAIAIGWNSKDGRAPALMYIKFS